MVQITSRETFRSYLSHEYSARGNRYTRFYVVTRITDRSSDNPISHLRFRYWRDLFTTFFQHRRILAFARFVFARLRKVLSHPKASNESLRYPLKMKNPIEISLALRGYRFPH